MNKSLQVEELKGLYAKFSKHSHYQILASSLSEIIGDHDLCVNSRYERERLKYIVSIVDTRGKKILDVGGNTGFFTFEILKLGAELVTYYEGNQEHFRFVDKARYLLGYEKKLLVYNKYLSVENDLLDQKYDIILLLNVLHHIGDDYGDKNLSIEDAKKIIINSINSLASVCQYLVLQLGFCWQGDRNKLLFTHGTKQEMIDFLCNGVDNHWGCIGIGIPENEGDVIKYVEMSQKNIMRNDSLGEFLNRPIFILESKVFL